MSPDRLQHSFYCTCLHHLTMFWSDKLPFKLKVKIRCLEKDIQTSSCGLINTIMVLIILLFILQFFSTQFRIPFNFFGSKCCTTEAPYIAIFCSCQIFSWSHHNCSSLWCISHISWHLLLHFPFTPKVSGWLPVLLRGPWFKHDWFTLHHPYHTSQTHCPPPARQTHCYGEPGLAPHTRHISIVCLW